MKLLSARKWFARIITILAMGPLLETGARSRSTSGAASFEAVTPAAAAGAVLETKWTDTVSGVGGGAGLKGDARKVNGAAPRKTTACW